MILELLKVISSRIFSRSEYPGQSVEVRASGFAEESNFEFYGLPGVVSSPPAGTRVILLPINDSRQFGVAVAGHNYQISISVDQGGLVIHSTNAAGTQIKATIKLKPSGEIEIDSDTENIKLNGDDKRLVTFSELNTALQTMVTAINATFAGKLNGGGAAGAVTLDISAAETQTVRTGG